MAVGAGSIKRASKLNTEATEPKKTGTTKAAAKPVAEETQKTTTKKTTTTKKSPAKKPAAEKPVAANKTIADEAAKKTKTVEIPVEPSQAQEAVEKKNSMNQVCHLTEALPIHLL